MNQAGLSLLCYATPLQIKSHFPPQVVCLTILLYFSLPPAELNCTVSLALSPPRQVKPYPSFQASQKAWISGMAW